MLTGHKLKLAREMYASGQYTVSAIAKTLGGSRASIYRHLDASAVLGARAGRMVRSE